MRKSREKLSSLNIAIVLVLFVWIILVAYLIMDENDKTDNIDNFVVASSAIEYDGERYVPNPSLQTILVMGLDTLEIIEDSGSYNNDYRSDYMSLVIFDDDAETYQVLSLNRDTMTDIPILDVTGEFLGYTNAQLALAYTYGNGLEMSAENSVDAVSKMLMDVNINRYMALGMSAIPILNDMVGGVTIEILDDFTSSDPEMIEGETITLNGEQALTYVRSRITLDDSSNLYRMERQSQYINALYEQMYSKINAGEISASQIYDVNDYLVTNCSTSDLSNMLEKFGEYEFLGFVTLEGVAEVYDVYMEYALDEESLFETILDLFYIKTSS